MADTVLQIVQRVCRRAAIPVPSIVISSSDPQVNQLQELFNEVGQDLLTRFRWQELVLRRTFVSVNAELQGNIETLLGFPLDAIVNGTLWDDTEQRPLYGPLDDRQYQYQKALIPAGPAYQYRIHDSKLYILPTIAAGHTISAIIRIKYWLINGATYKQEVTADDDQPLLDDKMLSLGLLARWKEEKGLPYAEDARRFEDMAITKASKSGTKPILRLDAPIPEAKPGIVVPPGSWPL